MSWDTYREYLVQRGVERCGIFGKEDGSPWCQASLKYNPDDVRNVKEILEKKDDIVYQNGVTMDDVKWTVVNFDKDESKLVLKGKNEHSKKTMCCCLTNKCLIVGTSESDKRAPEIATPLEDMQQHIKSHGY